jgi:hypothetical protein
MELPPPDLTQKFAPELTVVETVYSEDKQIRVSITRDARKTYRIHPERWDVSDLTTVGHAYWNQWGHSASLTDDLEIARAMACESLRITPRSSVIPDNDV